MTNKNNSTTQAAIDAIAYRMQSGGKMSEQELTKHVFNALKSIRRLENKLLADIEQKKLEDAEKLEKLAARLAIENSDMKLIRKQREKQEKERAEAIASDTFMQHLDAELTKAATAETVEDNWLEMEFDSELLSAPAVNATPSAAPDVNASQEFLDKLALNRDLFSAEAVVARSEKYGRANPEPSPNVAQALNEMKAIHAAPARAPAQQRPATQPQPARRGAFSANLNSARS